MFFSRKLISSMGNYSGITPMDISMSISSQTVWDRQVKEPLDENSFLTSTESQQYKELDSCQLFNRYQLGFNDQVFFDSDHKNGLSLHNNNNSRKYSHFTDCDDEDEIVYRITNLGDLDRREGLEYLDVLLNFSISQGWNPSPHDYESSFELYPDGYWVLEIYDDEIGSCWDVCSFVFAPIDHELRQGSAGLFITMEEYRRRGLGKILWEETVGKIPPSYNSWMTGVKRMMPFYEKCGYKNLGMVNLHQISEINGKESPNCRSFRTMNEAEKNQVREYITENSSVHLLNYFENIHTIGEETILDVFIHNSFVEGIGFARPLASKGWKYFFITNSTKISGELFEDMNHSVLEHKIDEDDVVVFMDILDKSEHDEYFKKEFGSRYVFCGKNFGAIMAKDLESSVPLDIIPDRSFSFFML